jgi:hypothetical protein
MVRVRPFSDEQSRLLINLRQRYETWIAAERDLATLPYDLRRKTVGGREYLYRIFDRSGNGTSLGPMDPEREAQFADYRARKQALKDRVCTLRTGLVEAAALYRALRLPLVSPDAGLIHQMSGLNT